MHEVQDLSRMLKQVIQQGRSDESSTEAYLCGIVEVSERCENESWRPLSASSPVSGSW